MLPEEPQVSIETRPEIFWSYSDIGWLFGILAAGFLALNGAAFFLLRPYPWLATSGPFAVAIQLILYAMLYFGFVFVFQKRYGQSVMPSLGWRRSSFSVPAAIGVGVLLAIVVEALALLFKTPEESPIEPFTKTPLSLALICIMAVTAAPLFEELFFRGFLQPVLTRDLGAAAGICIAGALFGLLHLPEYGLVWQYGVAITFVGIVLGYVRYRSGSVIPGTIVHACFNCISVLALIASKFSKHA